MCRSHRIETGTDLIGHLGLHDVTADGVAVEGCRRALVAQGVDILRGPGIAQFDTGLSCGLIADAGAWLQGGVGLYDLVPAVVVVPVDGAVGGDVVIQRTAEGREGRQAQTEGGGERLGDVQCAVEPCGVLPCTPLFLVVLADDHPLGRLHVEQRTLEACLELMLAQCEVEVLSDAPLSDMSFVGEVEPFEVHPVVRLVVTII